MTRRTTVTLAERELAALSTFEDRNGAEWVMLRLTADELSIPMTEKSSEATILRVLMAAGIQYINDRVLERGYAQLAEIWDEEHDEAEAREFQRRYAERVDRNYPA